MLGIQCIAYLLTISSLVYSAFVPAIVFHDYLKDGRAEDGPFPSSLKNIPYYCYQAPSRGPCERMTLVYFYDVVRRQCMPMMYSGCGGNDNRFNSKASCEIHCESKRRI